ncbi:MAG: hypothetical protein O3A13_04935 [Proteobacteria bacterium]|nr:hypothetical protein [Pseudomonadota bacterium]MDA0992958.1 hypothetical protein [Pseudomonadota bacterium]
MTHTVISSANKKVIKGPDVNCSVWIHSGRGTNSGQSPRTGRCGNRRRLAVHG